MKQDYASILLVGAIWGCTNPLVKQGSEAESTTSTTEKEKNIWNTLKQFQYTKVWIPYLFNQCGSIIYNILLASSDLTLTVPACNGIALVCSYLTSHFVCHERLTHPYRALFGSFLITIGVAICMYSSSTTPTTPS